MGGAAVALAVATLGGCARSQEVRPPTNPVGCYQIERTAEAREMGLPWGFELLGDALEEWPNVEGHRALTRVGPDRTADLPFSFWRREASDSIQVGYPGGGGFSLTLAQEGLRLVGTARPVGDAVGPGEGFGPRPAIPVVAYKVLCEPPSLP